MVGLYEPLDLGGLRLSNRVFMAPLTRNRALPNGVPGPWAETYYRQRASAGLIVTEATQISPTGKGYMNTPGIHAAEQVAGWREIVDAVHGAGGHIFLQLWHVGRISHTSLLPDQQAPVAPSAVQARAKTVTAAGFVDVSAPRALALEEIGGVVEDYGYAAANAKAAGFDGVELHAANGYLIDQFLQSGSNHRTDDYGGPPENRIRFLREVVRAVLAHWAPSRVGVRLSPRGTFNDMSDADPAGTFMAVVDDLAPLALGYLHLVEASPGDAPASQDVQSLFDAMRRRWPGLLIANGGYDREGGEVAVRRGKADAIAYGRAFLANPDLPVRLERGLPLNEPDQATFYGGDEHGYVDYPTWELAPSASGR